MTALIQNFREMRREESGWTMIEILYVMFALPILLSMVSYSVILTTQMTSDFQNDTLGINQGVVGDTATAIYDAVGRFQREHPDVVMTKEVLEQRGYVQLDDSFEWQVGTYGRDGIDTCVIVYSTSHQTDKYTALKPAEHNTHGLKTAAASPGCWFTNEDGEYGPDWQMRGRPPAPTFAERG